MKTELLEKTSMLLYKTCSKCGVEKLGSEFNRASQLKSGLRPECRECQRQYMRQYVLIESNRVRIRLLQQSPRQKEYERKRLKDPSRIAYCKKLQQGRYQRLKISIGYNVRILTPALSFLKALETAKVVEIKL